LKKKREDSMILMTTICNFHLTKRRNSLEEVAAVLILMTKLTIFLPQERNSKDSHRMQEVCKGRTFKETSILMNKMILLSNKRKMREKYRTVTWRNQMKML